MSAKSRLLLRELLVPPALTASALLLAFRLGSVVALEVPFFAAVIGSLWLAGTRAGLAVVVLSCIAIFFFFLPPSSELRESDIATGLEFVGFVVVSLLMISYARRLSIARDTLSATFRSTREGILVFDPGGAVRLMNRAAEEHTGWTERDARGRPVSEVFAVRDAETREPVAQDLVRSARRGRSSGGWKPKLLTHRDGSEVLVEDAVAPILEAERVAGFVLVFRDITQRQAIEKHLRRTERLQSIGTLAAGIAHQFNNLLTGIIGNAHLAVSVLRDGDAARPMLENALAASERMAVITRQLLDYSGKGRFVTEQVDLSRMVEETAELIRASVPETIPLGMETADTPLPVVADRSQLQQALIVLVANAAEALQDRDGRIHIRTGSEEIARGADDPPPSELDPKPGKYAYLEVEDTGCGMDEATLSRIFEPFFTTKFLGRGLGLPAVHGIAQSYGGAVKVESKPGAGSRFRLLLPLAPDRDEA
jgi:PAS domain S-box-containing protein